MALLGTDRRVLTLAFARMIDSVGNSFLIVVLPQFLDEVILDVPGGGGELLGVAVAQSVLIGVALSLFGFLNSFGQPFAGRLSDRTGKRRAFILVGLALLGVASGAYVFADSYAAILALRMLQGVGAALAIPATVALVNELATDATRGNNFGVFNTFRLIGFGFGPLIAGFLLEYGPYGTPVGTVSGFVAAFGVAALGAAVSFALVAAFVEDPERTAASAGDDLAVSVTDPDNAGLDPVFTLGVATLFMAIGIGLFATLEPQLSTRLSQGSVLFSVEFAAVVIANVVFQVPIGRASDRYGRRPFLVAGFVVLVPSLLAQGYVATPAAMVAARFVQGVAVALVFAPALALAGDLAKEGQSGTTLSVLTMAFGLGTAIGPLASGFLVTFGFVWPFAFGAALAALGLVLVYTQVEETVSEADELISAAPQD
ncbi:MULTISPECIES: MFS transporter [Halorussus]|uniref:MFS transporter n=1 Tax=Halorussus TaxID=1070314 RepID=UPI000E210196|nr:MULTISPECIES: MFS transporter [Halorussus]NHN58089.1 MFS transporter [Halorussus sp. JP-T4]